jgi:hypothetical protein
MVRTFITQMKNIQKPTLVTSTGNRHLCYKERTSRNINYTLMLIAIVLVVVPTTGCVVKHLHLELVVTFPQEVHQAADL